MGEPALLPVQGGSELERAEPAAGRLAQLHEHLVLRQREPGIGLQLPVQPGPQQRSRAQRAWRAYMRATTLLTARLNRQLQADSGLSLPEYEVLVQLSEAPNGKLRPFQLGLALEWEQSRLSHLLSRMSRRGFVVRRDCVGDRRGAEVVLTMAGSAAIKSAAPGHVAAVRRLVFDRMDSEQAAAFGQAFEAILAGLEDADPP